MWNKKARAQIENDMLPYTRDMGSHHSCNTTSDFESQQREMGFEPPRRFIKFLLLLLDRSDVTALVLGTVGAFGVFTFLYWLGTLKFDCPPWAVECTVQPAGSFFANRIGLVQGLVSSIYGIFIALIVQAAYCYAGSTLWPAWVEQSFTLRQVDRFLSSTRGNVASSPNVLWNAGKVGKAKLFTIVFLVGISAMLLHLNATIVGWAFTIQPISTRFLSRHKYGGGLGFSIGPNDPSQFFPAAVDPATALYSSWANGLSQEPLPQLRSYIIDRTNLSQIGDFSAYAVEAPRNINCSGMPIDFVPFSAKNATSQYNYDDILYMVKPSSAAFEEHIVLRLVNALTGWQDSTRFNSSDRVVSRIVFAQLNGTIENGYRNELPHWMAELCLKWYGAQCSELGISSLACDVDIALADGTACSSADCDPANATVSSIGLLKIPQTSDSISSYPAALALMPTAIGSFILNSQPMFVPGTSLVPNSPLALPVPFSDLHTYNESYHWTVANLTNFIDVAAGALGITINQELTSGSVTLESTLDMPRLDQRRALVLLAPPLFALACVATIAVLSATMYSEANIAEPRKGTASELLISADTLEMKQMIANVRDGQQDKSVFENTQLRYGRSTSCPTGGLGKPDVIHSFRSPIDKY